LRNYSKFLGIDEENIDQIIQTYNNLERKKIGLEETKKESIHLKRKDKSVFGRKKFPFPIKYVYLTSFVLIIFVGLFLLNRSLREAQNFPVPSPEIESETGINVEEKADDISILTEELIESEEEAIIVEYSVQDSVLANKLPILNFWETHQTLEIITEYPTKIEVYYDDEPIEISKGTIDNYLLKYNFKPTQNI
jgi:cytoskeletal protein RodZ